MDYPLSRIPITCILLALTLVILCNFPHIIAAIHHQYVIYEPDAYMRMLIVSDLLTHEHWHQHIIERINPPFGSDTHYWTRAVDGLILPGVWLLKLWMPTTQALYLWCFILPPITFFLATLGMLWAIKPLNPSRYQQFFIVAAFLLNPSLSPLFLPLDVDYDFLTVTLSIVFLGYFLRMIPAHLPFSKHTGHTPWQPKCHVMVYAAITAAIGCWTSISFLLFVLLVIALLIVLYSIDPKTYVKPIQWFLTVLCAGFAVLIAVEQTHLLAATYDILSIVHFTFIVLLLIGFSVFDMIAQTRKTTFKISIALMILTGIFLLMNAWFPGFYRGPYNQVDPYLLQHFFPHIVEFFSPFALDSGIALSIFIYFIISSVFFYDRRHQSIRLGEASILGMAFITTGFAAYMYRWNNYAGIINILLVSIVVAHFTAWIEKRITAKILAAILNIVLLSFVALLPKIILWINPDNSQAMLKLCLQQTYALATDNWLPHHPYIILANTNYTPYLLYTTAYIAVAGNYHHDPQGIKDVDLFFNGDEKTAKEVVMRRKVDLVLLCLPEQNHAQGFIGKLEHSSLPMWLRPIGLPQKYSQLRLYWVTH